MKKYMVWSLMLLSLVALVLAADSFITPGASGIVNGGSYVVNVSTDIGDEVVNCTVTITSATSGSSAATVYVYNESSDGTNNFANGTFDSTSVVDAGDYTFSASCVNITNGTGVATPSRSSITVDNTVPVCTWSQTSGTEYAPTQTWTVTCTNATSASLQFGGNAPFTMTESSDSCTYTPSTGDIPEAQYSTVVATTSDGRNTTSCTLTNIKIDAAINPKDVGVAMSGAAGAKKAGAPNNKNFMLIVLVAVGLWYFMKKKK